MGVVRSWALAMLLAQTVISCRQPVAARKAPVERPWGPIDLSNPFHRAEEWRFKQLTRLESPAEMQVRAAVQRRWPRLKFSREYACVAREEAAFLASNRALSDELLDRWIVGRCGASSLYYLTQSRVFPSEEKDATSVLDTAQLEAVLEPLAPMAEASQVFGVGTNVIGGILSVSAVFSTPGGTLKRSKPDADGTVRIEGSFFINAKDAYAIINHGEMGVADCVFQPETALPDFVVVCKMKDGDEEAWIDIGAFRSESFPSGVVLSTLAYRGNDPDQTYHRPFVRMLWNADPSKSLFLTLNDLRKRAGVAPVEFLAHQSEMAQHMMPRMFAAFAKLDNSSNDEFKARLMAGRRVPGPIRWAGATINIARGGNAGDWLGAELQIPTDRAFLLNPEVGQVAIGTHQEPGYGWGATVAGYRLFTSGLDRETGKQIFEQLARAREGARGGTRELPMPAELSELAEAVSSGRAEPERALRTALVVLNARSESFFDGVVLEPAALAPRLTFPQHLLARPKLEGFVVATYIKAPDEAWAHSIAFVIYVTESSERQARR